MAGPRVQKGDTRAALCAAVSILRPPEGLSDDLWDPRGEEISIDAAIALEEDPAPYIHRLRAAAAAGIPIAILHVGCISSGVALNAIS